MAGVLTFLISDNAVLTSASDKRCDSHHVFVPAKYLGPPAVPLKSKSLPSTLAKGALVWHIGYSGFCEYDMGFAAAAPRRVVPNAEIVAVFIVYDFYQERENGQNRRQERKHDMLCEIYSEMILTISEGHPPRLFTLLDAHHLPVMQRASDLLSNPRIAVVPWPRVQSVEQERCAETPDVE